MTEEALIILSKIKLSHRVGVKEAFNAPLGFELRMYISVINKKLAAIFYGVWQSTYYLIFRCYDATYVHKVGGELNSVVADVYLLYFNFLL